MMGLVAATGAFSETALTALVAGAILAGAPLMFAALGRAGLAARRRTQYRPRGDDADRRLRRLRGRLPRRQRVVWLRRRHGGGRRRVPADGALLRPLGSRPDRDRHRHHVALRGRDGAHLRGRVRGEPADAGRRRQGGDPRCRGDPDRWGQGRVRRQRLHAAGSSSTSAWGWPFSSRGCCAGRTWGSTSARRATRPPRSTQPA